MLRLQQLLAKKAWTRVRVTTARAAMVMLMLQAPGLRDYYRPLFRDMVYAALA